MQRPKSLKALGDYYQLFKVNVCSLGLLRIYLFHYSSVLLSVLLPSCFPVLACALSYCRLVFTVDCCQALQTFMVGDESGGFNCSLSTALSAQQCVLIKQTEDIGALLTKILPKQNPVGEASSSPRVFSTTEALTMLQTDPQQATGPAY